MTDYYELFKGEVEKTCGEYAAKVRDLQKQVERISKRLAEEKNNGERLQRRIEALKGKAGGENLTGDKNSYEKFRVSLTKLGRDSETSGTLQTALGQLLGEKTKDLALAENNLTLALRGCVVSCRPVADEKIEDLLLATFAEYDAFLETWRRIFDEFGHTFYCSSESFCPGPWPAREVEELRSRLDVSARRRASRKAAEVPKVAEPAASAQQKPQEAPQTVQDGQTPVEPMRIPI